MSNVIAVASQKGGTGKTTSTLNLAHGLAERGSSVLLVDIDPQSSLTFSVGLDPNTFEGKSIYSLLVQEDRGAATLATIQKTNIEGIDIIPSNIELASAEIELMQAFNREAVLESVLEPVSETYDYILIDCPPSLGLLTTNALRASQHIIIPVQCDILAIRGAMLLLRTIKKVQRQLNPDLNILGVLPTMHDARTRHSQEAYQLLKKQFPDKIFNTIIPNSVKAKDAAASGTTVLSHASSSDVARAYRKVTEEVEMRLSGETPRAEEPRDTVLSENV